MPTYSELVEQVRDLLDEPTAALWSDAMLRRWLNEGNKDLATVTRHYKSTHTVSLTAGSAEYVLPDDILAVEMAYYVDTVTGGTREIPLTASHWEAMDQIWGEHQSWEGAWPSMFTVWGNAPFLKLRLYPVPSVTGDTCRLLTAVLPTEIPSTGDDETLADVPPAWVQCLVDWCRYRAHLRDRDMAMADQALRAYENKREGLIYANDYLAVNREVVPDSRAGWLPRWLVEFDSWV